MGQYVAAAGSLQIESFNLKGNYPNPFNPGTTIEYRLGTPGFVILTVYNTRGETIRELVRAAQPEGVYQVSWDGQDQQGRALSSGLYIYQLRFRNDVRTGKAYLLR